MQRCTQGKRIPQQILLTIIAFSCNMKNSSPHAIPDFVSNVQWRLIGSSQSSRPGTMAHITALSRCGVLTMPSDWCLTALSFDSEVNCLPVRLPARAPRQPHPFISFPDPKALELTIVYRSTVRQCSCQTVVAVLTMNVGKAKFVFDLCGP
ncbi:hypothetical protein BDV96DRAFT_89965 [Lophiotrema nucula]|uniref:Uncharacterized protein n=1 Tax=Lophiotrema nucula TaxID=690887 RepID=A0A6A5Z6L6_9PLEO|nr:hypothetical protein BDV96DRAFT_89965 [Lophiotrema nucula]